MDRMVKPVDGWMNPENSLVEVKVVYIPIIYKALAPSQVVVWDFWTINSISMGGCVVRRGAGAEIFGDMIGLVKNASW